MVKRRRSGEALSEGYVHPYGVKPSGHVWFVADGGAKLLSRSSGWGPRCARVPDEILVHMLEWLDAESLLAVACVSKLTRVFAHSDTVWRELVLNSWSKFEDDFNFLGSWRSSYLRREIPQGAKIESGIYASDALFRPWQYSMAEIRACWAEREHVERVSERIPVERFISDYETPKRPVVLENQLDSDSWPCFQQWFREEIPQGSRDVLHLGDIVESAISLRVGPVDMRLKDFVKYASLQRDESPLYLFDCKFGEKLPSLASSYSVPDVFRNTEDHRDRDLLSCLGDEARPDYRWLVAGPARSGSKWHIDPNGTHAWNAVVSGRKKWILYPPGKPPPGVKPSEDGLDVAQPVSLIEWFVLYYDTQVHPIEFVASPGDLVFVPAGWWHCVLNLDASVAITQNYVAASNLRACLHLFQKKAHLISGLGTDQDASSLYGSFRAELAREHRGLLQEIDELDEQAEKDKSFSFSFFEAK